MSCRFTAFHVVPRASRFPRWSLLLPDGPVPDPSEEERHSLAEGRRGYVGRRDGGYLRQQLVYLEHRHGADALPTLHGRRHVGGKLNPASHRPGDVEHRSRGRLPGLDRHGTLQVVRDADAAKMVARGRDLRGLVVREAPLDDLERLPESVSYTHLRAH